MVVSAMPMLTEMPERNPISGTFEVTVRCNLHCKMCLFKHADSENACLREQELTTEQWIDLAKQIAEAGTMNLLITGGEPMVRSDFCELWEGIYQQGFIIELYTNATMITPRIMETLRKYPPHKLAVTIYGASPETYEKVCGSAVAFEKMKAGIKELQTLPSVFEVRSTLIRDNRDDMLAIHKLVKELFPEKVSFSIANRIHQSVRGACADVNDCRLSPKEMKECQLEHVYQLIRDVVGDDFSPEAVKFTRQEMQSLDVDCKTTQLSLLGCHAGMSSYTITYDGKLLPCQVLGVFSTNAVQAGFQSAWEELPYKVNLPQISEECITCEEAQFCSSCYASRFAETQQLNGCSAYMKQEAKASHEFYNKYYNR